MFNKNKSQKAFTLIELLVVMAIIAILSAIMFGPIQTARRRAKDTQAVADMKLLQNYLTLWADDHSGTYPNTLSELSVYGSLPSRINTSTTVKMWDKYNYVLIGASGCNSTNNCTGYQIWTRLSDTNPAFDSDADCNSADIGDTDCWANTSIYNNLSIDTGLDGSPSASVCKNLLDTNSPTCILDYTN